MAPVSSRRILGRQNAAIGVALFLVAGPVLAGAIGTLLPAAGYLPAIGANSLSLAPFDALLSVPGIAVSILLSFGTGLAATLLSLAAVLLFTAGWLDTRVFRWVARCLSPLLSVPHAAAAIGLAFLIAPSGFLVRLVSPWATGWTRPPDILILHDPAGLAMVFGLAAKEIPFLFLMVLAALPQTNAPQLMKAATSLGYSRSRAFFVAVLPVLYPQIRLPVLAVIAYSTSVVDVALILGPTTPAPLAPRILEWMADPDTKTRLMASAGALLQLGISAAAVLTYLGLERLAKAVGQRFCESGQRGRFDMAPRYAGLAVMMTVILAMALAFLLLALWAFSKSWWFPAPLPSKVSLAPLWNVFGSAGSPVAASLVIGLPVAAGATALTIWLLEQGGTARATRSAAMKAVIFLPLMVPQVSLLFGLQVLFLMAPFSANWIAVAFCHLVFVFPYAYLALSDPWRHLNPRFQQVATSLGASNARVFWQVKLPLLLRPVLVTLALSFAVSIAQYLPTQMIGAGRVETVTTESVALASGGNRHLAALYALLQLVLPLFGFLLAAFIPALLFRNRAALRVSG